MRRMGGLWKHIKVTYVMMWIGSLALAGLPFFAGYYSKDGILEAAWAAGTTVGYYAFAMGIGAAVLTAFYSRSEEHTSELQSLMRISYAVFCLKKKNINTTLTINA